jgi:hypothetical protein
VVDGTHTYDGSPVFQPAAVRLGDNVVTRVQKDSLVVIDENWDALPAGIPTRWVPTGGTTFRVTPTPSAAAAGIIGTIAAAPTAGGTGYAVDDVLTLSTGNADAEVIVTAVTGGVVTALALNSATNDQDKIVYVRGTGYSVDTGQATTGGTGTGCTVSVTALAKLEVYGPASVDDLTILTACTVADTGDLVTSTAHDLAVNDAIAFSGTTGGFTAYKTYYVKTIPSVDTFTLSESVGGSTFAITADGSNVWGLDTLSYVSEAADEAILQAGEEELWRSRPNMPGAREMAATARALWDVECEKIKKALRIA